MTTAEKQIELDNLEKALGQIQDAIKKIENTEAEAPPAPSDTKALWQEKIAESDGVIFVTNKLTSIECIDALIAEGYFDLTDDIWVKPFES
jgi:vacuolar-type H+-ATPase subunit I/STV1